MFRGYFLRNDVDLGKMLEEVSCHFDVFPQRFWAEALLIQLSTKPGDSPIDRGRRRPATLGDTQQRVDARSSFTSPPNIVLRQVAVQPAVSASFLRKIVRYIRRTRLTNVDLSTIEEAKKCAGIVMIAPDGPWTQVLLV